MGMVAAEIRLAESTAAARAKEQELAGAASNTGGGTNPTATEATKSTNLLLLLMLVAQMSTYPRVIATHYCCWGSTKFKPTHGALTAFEDLGVQPRRPCSPWTLRLTTFVVVISSWDLMVTSTGSRACESKPTRSGMSEQASSLATIHLLGGVASFLAG